MADLELFLEHALQMKLIEPSAYLDAVTALAEAQLALVRAGRPVAEPALRRASAAESRLFGRRAVPSWVRDSVRAAVAVATTLAAGQPPNEAAGWLSQLETALAA
jgi:hypothetical protein